MEKLNNWLKIPLFGWLLDVALRIAGYFMFFSIFGVVWVSLGVVLIALAFLVLFGWLHVGLGPYALVLAVFIYAFLTTSTTLLGMLHYRLKLKQKKE